jgi:hypothetical protein
MLINSQGHNIQCGAGVLEHVQRSGYTEEFGAGPIEEAALEILGDVQRKNCLATAPGRLTASLVTIGAPISAF